MHFSSVNFVSLLFKLRLNSNIYPQIPAAMSSAVGTMSHEGKKEKHLFFAFDLLIAVDVSWF